MLVASTLVSAAVLVAPGSAGAQEPIDSTTALKRACEAAVNNFLYVTNRHQDHPGAARERRQRLPDRPRPCRELRGHRGFDALRRVVQDRQLQGAKRHVRKLGDHGRSLDTVRLERDGPGESRRLASPREMRDPSENGPPRPGTGSLTGTTSPYYTVS